MKKIRRKKYPGVNKQQTINLSKCQANNNSKYHIAIPTLFNTHAYTRIVKQTATFEKDTCIVFKNGPFCSIQAKIPKDRAKSYFGGTEYVVVYLVFHKFSSHTFRDNYA